jgi:hypothetical protein
MFQLPICAAHDVPGYRSICRRHGILRGVRRTDINPGGFGKIHACRVSQLG